MAIDPFGDTLEALLEGAESEAGTGGGTAASGGAMQSWINMVMSKRPTWVAQQAASEYAKQSASTAPLWRWARVKGPQWNESVRGTSMRATVRGGGDLGMTLGIPVVVAIGVWVMLGANYMLARQEVRRKGFMRGFSQGFTTGILDWKWEQAVRLFAMPFAIRRNSFAPELDREEAMSFNEGLIKGWATGNAVPNNFIMDHLSEKDKKKIYRIALRQLANRHDSAAWSKDQDEARNQQISYVIQLAGAGLKNGMIVPE